MRGAVPGFAEGDVVANIETLSVSKSVHSKGEPLKERLLVREERLILVV